MHRTRDVLELTTHSCERGRQHFLTGRERTPTRCTSTTDGACSVGEKGIQWRDQPNSWELELILPPGRSPWPSQIPVSKPIAASRHQHLVQGWASGNPKRGRKRQQTGFEAAPQTSFENFEVLGSLHLIFTLFATTRVRVQGTYVTMEAIEQHDL
jgi:hypothetical protein